MFGKTLDLVGIRTVLQTFFFPPVSAFNCVLVVVYRGVVVCIRKPRLFGFMVNAVYLIYF